MAVEAMEVGITGSTRHRRRRAYYSKVFRMTVGALPERINMLQMQQPRVMLIPEAVEVAAVLEALP